MQKLAAPETVQKNQEDCLDFVPEVILCFRRDYGLWRCSYSHRRRLVGLGGVLSPKYNLVCIREREVKRTGAPF